MNKFNPFFSISDYYNKYLAFVLVADTVGTPWNLTVLSSTPFSLEVSWSAPVANGEITGYMLLIAYHNGSQLAVRHTPLLTYSITNLSPYQYITVNVTAYINDKQGPPATLQAYTQEYSKPLRYSSHTHTHTHTMTCTERYSSSTSCLH